MLLPVPMKRMNAVSELLIPLHLTALLILLHMAALRLLSYAWPQTPECQVSPFFDVFPPCLRQYASINNICNNPHHDNLTHHGVQ